MRNFAFVAVMCLVMSPIANADEQVVFDVDRGSFFTGVWAAISAIPIMALEKVTSGTSNDGDDDDTETSSMEPPETEAGPMIIIDG